MATLNGFIRSYGAAVRRAEREQQRETREAMKRFKEQQKHLEIQNASEAVEEWNRYISIIKSLHTDSSETVDWISISKESRPNEPEFLWKHEVVAQQKLKNYKPNILDKVFGLTKSKIKKLESQVVSAKERDKAEYDLALADYRENLISWETLQKIAEGIKTKNPQSYADAITYFKPFSEISELGTNVNFEFKQENLEVDLKINSIDIIPDYELKQTSTGKLSKKAMSKSNFLELYQDHICSAVLRVAREVFAYLPIEFVIVNAVTDMVDGKSGYIEKKVILSVKIPLQTIQQINLEQIDPSEAMKNFLHNMNFKKTSGFQEVERVK